MFQLKWLWKNMGNAKKDFMWGNVLNVVTAVLYIIFLVDLQRRIVDDCVTKQDTTLLLPYLGGILILTVLRNVFRFLMHYLYERNVQTTADNIRAKLFHVIENSDYKFLGKNRTGDLMTRLSSDIDTAMSVVSYIALVGLDQIAVLVSCFLYLVFIDWRLTLMILTVAPVVTILTLTFSKVMRPLYNELRNKLSDINTVAQENIEGNRVVKAFAREEYENKKFDIENREFRAINLKATYKTVKFQPIISFLSQIAGVVIMVVGGIFMINGDITAGGFLAFTSMSWTLITPIVNLGNIAVTYQRCAASINMLIDVYYSAPSIMDRADAIAPETRAEGEIEFKNVGFTINDKKVVEDINFKVKAGATLGIMGTTGSGKTTLTNLLMRFYEPNEGEIFMDGRNINQYTLKYLRSSMGIAMQDVFLFSETVDSNIAYGRPDMSHEEAVKYAKAANADKFINNLSDGYKTVIGERGVGLSGGQRQRIALTRALAMRPSVLILDDTTSAVDMETEQYIQSELKNLDFDCTKIIIAQRISSVQDADEIIFMDEGRIIERGTHKELMALEGAYYNIWNLQNKMKEEVKE